MFRILIVAWTTAFLAGSVTATGWVDRDHRWPTRGPWMWALQKNLPALTVEFNGIDFGHAHLAETLLKTQDPQRVERARLEVLEFIFSEPEVVPDEPLVAPRWTLMVWELQKTFNWTHELHRSLYDLYASDVGGRKKADGFERILTDYLSKPEAITSHRLDHHGKMWSFPESKAFSEKYPKFNTQIWAYHWLQGGVYDVQRMGDPQRQRELMEPIIAHYHSYLRDPPIQWQFMPMIEEAAPNFAREHPEVAAIFDNLHMLHDNVDDVLCRPDLYSGTHEQRRRILDILEIYLDRNHRGQDRFASYHMPEMRGDDGGHGMSDMGMMGPRPPSVQMVLAGETSDVQPSSHSMNAGMNAKAHPARSKDNAGGHEVEIENAEARPRNGQHAGH